MTAQQVVVRLERRGRSEILANGHVYPIDDALLREDAVLTVGKRTSTLEKIVERIALFRLNSDVSFREEELHDIGAYLFACTAGAIPRGSRPASNVDLRIVTDDKFYRLLPWAVLVDGTDYLSTSRGWMISLAAEPSACGDHVLPSSPKILVIAPQPPQRAETRATEHIDELVAMLQAARLPYALGANFFVAEDLQQTKAQLEAFQPDIVYFYGHGIGSSANSSVLFTSTEADQTKVEKPLTASDFADLLRGTCKRAPSLVYVNCCMGEAGGLLGVGRQLASFVPAVVTNSSAAYIPAACAQARTFWREVLIEGARPHEALAAVRRGAVPNLGLTHADLRWLVPTIHIRYRDWISDVPARRSREPDDVARELKLDRTHQFGQVLYRTRMLMEQRRRRRSVLACVWYGRQGQGLEQFHERLHVELPQHLEDFQYDRVKPHWPEHWADFRKTAGDMLARAFEVQRDDEIAHEVLSRYTDRNTLVYIDHTMLVLRSEKETPFDLKRLRHYLDWLNQTFARDLPENVYALLGISFVTPDPEGFRNEFLGPGGIIELDLDRLRVELLAEMKSLEWEDLLDYIRTHDIAWPSDPQRRRSLFNEIVAKTQGDYNQTLREILSIDPYE